MSCQSNGGFGSGSNPDGGGDKRDHLRKLIHDQKVIKLSMAEHRRKIALNRAKLEGLEVRRAAARERLKEIQEEKRQQRGEE
jgi:hypothetical protein